MLPEIYKTPSDASGATLEYHYFFEVSQESLWEILTSNYALEEWVPVLTYQELEATSLINVKTPEKKFNEEILAVDSPARLYFTWKKGWIRIELIPEAQNKTRLHFSLWTPHIQDNTVQDLSNWIVNMEVIEAQLADLPLIDRSERLDAIAPIVKKELLKKPEQL